MDSDINYLIQVKVICRLTTFPALTEFTPIEGVASDDFNRAHGDSFISEFAEGGELNALISIKLRDKSKEQEVRDQLAIYFNLRKVLSPTVVPLLPEDVGELNIALSCSGGGGIDDKVAAEWTLEKLRTVALEFPEQVVASPLRSE